MDKYIGRLLDNRYEILEVIGTGGMAVVYKARCHRLNRLVALKILKDENSKDEDFRRRFHAESQAVAMLSHPNIVSVYDVSSSDEADYIVMELIEGISLKQYMEKKGILNWKETLHFSMQIAKALEHAHSRGIIHRDIKPHNVMVLKNGSVKVADFGIARVMSKSNTLTKEALGSVHYISPEQAKGGRVDNRSDIYSLGVVMYEMMTGRPPYDGESPVAVAIQHINGGAAMPATLNPNIPGGLEQIIMKAMAHDPGKRYTNATAMLYDMDEFRKAPSILFDYQGSGSEEMPQLHIKPTNTAGAEAPKTVAEKTAGQQNASKPKSRAGQQPQNAPRRRPAQPRYPEDDDDDDRSQAATVAVVICSIVALVAIGIFLYTLLNGGLILTPQRVRVPDLVGQNYENLLTFDDIEIVIRENVYSDQYEKGYIIDQEPKGGRSVAKGTEVYLTISKGPETNNKVMPDLVSENTSADDAQDFLNDLNAGLKINARKEASETVAVGHVIRTDPAAGETLTPGQTVVLWISIGPVAEKVKMPLVVGYEENTAREKLRDVGLTNVDVSYVESDRAAGTVIYQSQERNEEVEVTTTIYLQVSKGLGNGGSTGPTDPEIPTSPPDTYVKKTVTIPLPERQGDYTLTLLLGGKPVDGCKDIPIYEKTAYLTLTLMGEGTQYYEIFINGQYYRTIPVDFSVAE